MAIFGRTANRTDRLLLREASKAYSFSSMLFFAFSEQGAVDDCGAKHGQSIVCDLAGSDATPWRDTTSAAEQQGQTSDAGVPTIARDPVRMILAQELPFAAPARGGNQAQDVGLDKADFCTMGSA